MQQQNQITNDLIKSGFPVSNIEVIVRNIAIDIKIDIFTRVSVVYTMNNTKPVCLEL